MSKIISLFCVSVFAAVSFIIMMSIIMMTTNNNNQVLAAKSSVKAGSEISVTTPLGDMVGLTNEYGGYNFLGVRFATPPIGTNRFKAPQDIAPWTEPQNATYLKSGCIQHCPGGRFAKLMCPSLLSEDCLFLNIFTPTLNKDAKLPVIIFWHGGMTTWGSSQIPLYDESLWAGQNQFVGVAANYRLNIFGGLMTESLEGNFHTRDQIQALKFLQQTIASFGGDPNNVKIFGESSGATAVGVLLTTPAAWPYFNGAIVLSDPIGFTLASKKMATELGELCALKLGCPINKNSTSAYDDQLACLQSKSTEELLAASKTSYLPTPNEVLSVILQWQPSIDGNLVVMDPVAAFEAGKFHKVPLYINNDANETAIFLDGVDINATNALLEIALDYIFGFTDEATIEALYGPIPPSFAGGGMMFFSRILTDYTFGCPMQHVADIVSSHGIPVYYSFYDLVESWVPWYLNSTTNECTKLACHAFELPNYFFSGYKQLPVDFPHFHPDELKLSQFIQHVVGAFAHANYGQLASLGFPSWNSTSRMMYNYSVPIPTATMSGYRRKQCALWSKIGWNRH